MAVTRKEKEAIAGLLAGACAPHRLCPVKDIMAGYGDKWTMYVVLLLGQQQPLRFSGLLAGIPGISQRMLTVTLRALEADGIITRTMFTEIPPRVEYGLTPVGESLLKPLLHLAHWAGEHAGAIAKARKKSSRPEGPKGG